MDSFRKITLIILILTLCFLCYQVSGCASGADIKSNGKSTLMIRLAVDPAGKIDDSGRGYYGILFNGFSEDIEVTNYETFTDFIRYDGFNFTWYHRQGNVPSPGYTWVNAGNLNADSQISGDGTALLIRISLEDTAHVFNQYLESNRFSVHVVTTDQNNSLLGRAIDTLGQGPSIDGNALYTVFFDKLNGIVNPEPPMYPSDPVGDYDVKSDLGDEFPYENFDLESFSVELQ